MSNQQPNLLSAYAGFKIFHYRIRELIQPKRLSFVDTRDGIEANRMAGSEGAMEGPSGESTCYQPNINAWLPRDQSSDCSSTSGAISNDWGRCSMPSLWGGRIVGRRQVKSATGSWSLQGEEYDAFKEVLFFIVTCPSKHC